MSPLYHIFIVSETPKSPSDSLCGDFRARVFGGWTPFSLERGPLEKESLEEYGSGWEWDNKWPKVFDYTQTDSEIPMRYENAMSTAKPIVYDTWVDYGNTSSKKVEFPYCEIEQTNGIRLTSWTQYINSISCAPHIYNAGNYYNIPLQLGDAKNNSVCPRGWRLPENETKAGYSSLLASYGIDYEYQYKTNHSAGLLNQPISLIYVGNYSVNGPLNNREDQGRYRTASQKLYFHAGYLSPSDGADTGSGYPIRCVSR